MTIKIKKTKINLLLLQKVIFALIAVLLSFSSLISNSSRIITILLITLTGITFMNRLKDSNFSIRKGSPFFIWVLLYTYILFNKGPIGFSRNYFAWPVDVFCLLFVMIFNSENKDELIIWFLNVIIICESINAFFTIFLWIFPETYFFFRERFLSQHLYIANAGYKSGLTTHYSTNGVLLTLGMLASFSMAITRKKRYYVLFGISLFALILTSKRAHLVFGVISCAVAFMIFNKNRGLNKILKYFLLVLIFAIVWFIAAQFIPELGETFVRLQNIEDEARSSYWELCIEMFRTKPIFGNGWKSFTDNLYRTWMAISLLNRGNTNQDAHNVYFQVLAEQGIIGEILFLIAIGISLYQSVRVMNNQTRVLSEINNVNDLILIRYSLSMQLFFILYCLTGNPFFTSMCYIPYFISLGCLFTYKPDCYKISSKLSADKYLLRKKIFD